MTRKRCDCCQQFLPLPKAHGISPNTIRARIYDLVRRSGDSGVLSTDVFDLVYASDADGGPASGMSCLRAHVSYLNRILKRSNQRIAAVGYGRGIGYKGGNGVPGYYILTQIEVNA